MPSSGNLWQKRIKARKTGFLIFYIKRMSTDVVKLLTSYLDSRDVNTFARSIDILLDKEYIKYRNAIAKCWNTNAIANPKITVLIKELINYVTLSKKISR
jgi:hypothetical protein